MRSSLLLAFVVLAACSDSRAAPPPGPVDGKPAERAVLAGGCFWGVEAVFEALDGVHAARSGYAGGSSATATYGLVSTGATDHAEAVEVIYDPSRITYAQLLQVFFSVAHDPTQKDRQGPDVGRQYRSAIFAADDAQLAAARAHVAELDRAGALGKPIVTELVKLEAFFPAEDHHQDFVRKNPTHPYVVHHDIPKLEQLRRRFPSLVRRRS